VFTLQAEKSPELVKPAAAFLFYHLLFLFSFLKKDPMGFEVTGKLYRKLEEQQVSDKFRKREFVLEIQDGQYPQHIKFQLVQDRVALIDQYKEGDTVKVFFDLTGREFDKGGEKLYFTNLSCWKMESGGGSPQGGASKSDKDPWDAEPTKGGAADFLGGADEDLPF
jgi:single-strand DNA-binding protein